VLIRIALFIVIVLFAALGYMTYLNHEIPVTLFVVQGKPLHTSLPAVIIVSFASGALIVFLATLMRDLVEGWKDLKRGRKEKRDESAQMETAKGLTLMAQGDPKGAQFHLTHALRQDPENLALCLNLSDIYGAQGRFEDAIAMLDRAWAIDSQNLETLLKKAKLYDQMGNRVLATTTLEKIRTMAPGNRRALIDLRNIHLREENWEKALALQRSILRDRKNGPDVAQEKDLYLGIAYERAQTLLAENHEGSIEKSIRLCKEIIKQDREFLPTYVLLGDIYQKQRRWAEAGRVLGRGFRVSKHVIFLLRLEDLYLRRDDRKTLLKIYRRTIENNPETLAFSFFYARLCLKLNMLDEAMDELVEIKERWNTMAPLHGLMAEILTSKGHLEKAVHAYRTATQLTRFGQPVFFCRFCQRKSTEWTARCPTCRQWNGYLLEVQEETGPSAKA
jgi:tetratricopeptide (TPR) repeat protein